MKDNEIEKALEDQVWRGMNEADVRAIARQEIASLCGLILRRLQDEHPTRSFERNTMEDVIDRQLSQIFGEALKQFGDHTEEAA